MSQMNMGPGPAPQGRPGQMTAVMRAMNVAQGPKVLRIGLVQSGRIVEERIVKQRVHVTVGPSEKAMFVITAANIPAQFRLFELLGNEYHLNFLDGMGGRVALQTGITDLGALKGQARRVGPAYQVKLTEDARGKVTIGDTTFLFQFVAPPPVQPRPQLPLAVKGGLSAQIDWNLTIISAFSFMFHFGIVGAMYSDWMDPVVNDDVAVSGLIDMVKSAAPPPAEPPKEEDKNANKDDTSAKQAEKKAAPQPHQQQTAGAQKGGASAPDPKVVAGLLNEAEQAKIAILAALGAAGPATAGSLRDDNGAPVDLNKLASGGGGINNQGGSGLNLGPGGGGPITPGRGGSLQDIKGGQTSSGNSSGAGTAERVVPVGNVSAGGVAQSVPVANAEAVIRGQIAGAARACYQRGLAEDPTMQGKVSLSIQIGPSGEVTGASPSVSGNISPKVASCIASAARRAKFSSPGDTGSTVSCSFSFVSSAPK